MFSYFHSDRPVRVGRGGLSPLRGGILALLSLLALTPRIAMAQTPAPTYSLAQTIEAALASSAEVETATRNVQIDRKQVDAELARLRPGVRVDANATQYDAKTQVSIAGSPPVTLLHDNTEVLSAGVSLDLDVSGQIRAAASQAKLQGLADQFTLTTVRNQRILTAKSVYYNLLRAEHQVQVAQAALTTAKQQQSLAVKLNLGQVGQKIDVLRANTQVADGEQELTNAQNNRDIARNTFNDLIGRPLDAPVQAQDVPGVTVGVDVGPNAPKNNPLAQTPPYSVPQGDLAAIDVTGSLASAAQRRPEVLTAQVQVRVAETGVKLAHSGLEPTVALSVGANYYPTTSFQAPRQTVGAVTLGISFPLYDGGATRARVQAARLQTENARTFLDRRKKDVALEVRQAYLNLVTAAHQIDAANTALQQAIATRQLAQTRYEGQVGLYLEVTDAQAALVQAENSQVNAVYDYLIARAQFENAIGVPSTK
ncbi:MAG TPA: TolC family protein [Chthonomonadaceae bacterium]|nr:TolC family protein [Chthonomonadaceae bacterium]